MRRTITITELPLVALRETVIFPEMIVPLQVGRDKSVAALNAAGHRTGTGRPFDIKAVQWARRVLDVPIPGPLRPGEISVADAATRLDRFAEGMAARLRYPAPPIA